MASFGRRVPATNCPPQTRRLQCRTRRPSSPSIPLRSDYVVLEPFEDILQPHAAGMRCALEQARQAFDEGEVPVGAVVVHRDRVIAEAHNQREMLNDPTAHAEMIALTQAAQSLGSWRLLDCTLYVTLEPCPMCAGAIVQARLPVVIYGAADLKAGACDTLFRITTDERLNHQATVLGGVLAEECRLLLQEFFARQRALGKK
jgi:tRNA(adenine34) deaminase